VSSGAGTHLLTMTGLQAEMSFFGSTAKADVDLMRSLYAAPPVRKNGAPSTTRTVTDGVITGGTTLTSATAVFTSGDTGARIRGDGIPSGTTATFVNSTTVTLSQAATNGSSLWVNIGEGGVATTVYGLHVGAVKASDTGAKTAYGLFVQGGSTAAGIGQSQFGGPVTINPGHAADVPLIIKMAPSPTGNALTLFDATNGIKARITNAGIVASSNRVIGWEGNAGKQVTIGDQGPSNATAGVSFGTATDTLLWRKAAGVLVMSTGDVTAPASFVGQGLMFGNITTAPTAAPVGGGMLYVQGGALKYIGTSNTITPLAPA
jgi:hypothetical protein